MPGVGHPSPATRASIRRVVPLVQRVVTGQRLVVARTCKKQITKECPPAGLLWTGAGSEVRAQDRPPRPAPRPGMVDVTAPPTTWLRS